MYLNTSSSTKSTSTISTIQPRKKTNETAVVNEQCSIFTVLPHDCLIVLCTDDATLLHNIQHVNFQKCGCYVREGILYSDGLWLAVICLAGQSWSVWLLYKYSSLLSVYCWCSVNRQMEDKKKMSFRLTRMKVWLKGWLYPTYFDKCFDSLIPTWINHTRKFPLNLLQWLPVVGSELTAFGAAFKLETHVSNGHKASVIWPTFNSLPSLTET